MRHRADCKYLFDDSSVHQCHSVDSELTWLRIVEQTAQRLQHAIENNDLVKTALEIMTLRSAINQRIITVLEREVACERSLSQ